jgi:hypothetical protein
MSLVTTMFLRARHRVTIRPAYQAGLRRRGDLTFWLDEAVLEE